MSTPTRAGPTTAAAPLERHRRAWLARAYLLLLIVGLTLLAASPPLVRAEEDPRLHVATVDGTITPVMARYVERVIRQAEDDGAAAIVLKLDTPGGLSSAMDDIVRDILESEVPVVVYVAPRGARAASAGVFITYAAHVAAMAPGTNIGSASPVFVEDDGSVSDGSETIQRKVTNDAVARIRNLAELRGRNADWAEQAVREAVNVTADEAARLGVVDLLAADVDELTARIDGRTVQLESAPTTINVRGATIEEVEMTFVEGLLQIFVDPTVAYILLSIGMLGLFFELSNPGSVLPGVVGGLALLLGLLGLGTLPVNWAGVLLIGFAFVLFVADLYVPSLGALTVGGVISFLLGSYLLIGSDAPPGIEIARPVIWTMTACIVAFFLFLAASVVRARLRPPATGAQTLIGDIAVVRRRLAPRGMVFVQGELWEAEVDPGVSAAAVEADTNVVVTAIEGLTLRVRPATEADLARVPPAPDRRAVIPVGPRTGAASARNA